MDFAFKTFGLLFVRILSIPLIVGSSVVLARVLGAEFLGMYNSLLAVPLAVISFLGFGLPAASVYHLRKKPEASGEIICNILMIAGFVSALLILLFLILFPLLSQIYYQKSDFIQYLPFLLLIIPTRMLYRFLPSIGRGLYEIVPFSFVSSVVLPVTSIAGYLLFVYFFDMGVKGALLTSFLAFLIIDLVLLTFIFRRVKTKLKPSFAELKENLKYGWKSYVASFANKAAGHLDMLLFIRFFSMKEIGIYAVAKSAASFTRFFHTVVSPALFPKVAGTDNEKNKVFMCRFLRFFLFIMVLSFVGMMVLGKLMILLFYGKAFQDSVALFYLLVPGMIGFALSEVIIHYFMGRNQLGRHIFLYYFKFVVTALFIYLFSHAWGMKGACLGISLSSLLTALVAGGIFFYSGEKVALRDVLFLNRRDLIYLIDTLKVFTKKNLINMKEWLNGNKKTRSVH